MKAIHRQWRKMPQGSSWDDAWQRVGPAINQIVTVAQRRIATAALAYVPAVIEDTGQTQNFDADATDVINPLVGVAGDGRPVDSLAYGAVVHSGTAYDTGSTPFQALKSGGEWLTVAMGTALSDTGREAESLAMGTRRVRTYVRMLVPPSCPRCTILAGQVSHTSQAFPRHTNCDCRNIPLNESIAGDYTTDPHAYFHSLTKDQQNEVFGEGDAEAVRSGADIFQVVNAHRNTRLAQVGGRKVWLTSEGTTRRGFAYSRLSTSAGKDIKAGRYRRTNRPRLMPSTIRRIATSREDYLRLLYANGYVI
ncbi:hypothetical protein [Luteimicrobium album]|uniref:hypothetical protein n=1 Tax=Luteimicrobium album TaxID=1054550 RepID=UPI0024E0C7B1|nr:hypothetical protein [Luteimicrobium album]